MEFIEFEAKEDDDGRRLDKAAKRIFESKGLQPENIFKLIRKTLIKLIMDEFNRTIFELSKQYNNVYFIDLRNTVPQDKKFWHDEIHLNDRGFKLVADKFISKLKSIGI